MTSITWISVVLMVVVCYNGVHSQSFDTNSCINMLPQQVAGSPQAKPPIFKMIVHKKTYKTTDSIKVVLRSEKPISTFMISARLANKVVDRSLNFGHFKATDIQTKSICTDSYGSAITTVNPANREVIHLEWTTQASTKGHIVFKASVVYPNGEFWVGERSEMIIDESSPPPPKNPNDRAMPPSDSLTTALCGTSKGCYRNPPGCAPENCDVIVSWSDSKDHVDFQLLGDTEGWVSVAFSKDAKLGSDEAFECYWNDTAHQVEVKHVRIRDDGRVLVVKSENSLKNKHGRMNDKRVSCSFRRNKEVQGQTNFFGERKYLLLSKGRVDKNGKKIYHEQESSKYPYVSPRKVKDSDVMDLNDTLRYPLVKLHGCLMVVAWMVCAMSGLLISKYYRPMWPNSRACNKRVWYSTYMFCMLTCLVLTIIAFIVIFIHGNGYITMPIYPNKAHPPIGICVTILIILIPVLAICRPTEPNPSNGAGICINWILWLLETAVSVLATVNLFIGLNLPKAHVPWWTSWVMVSFFLFHLIVELMLEIHGCLNSKKQDVRYQKFMNDGKTRNEPEPEPVGRNFKQNLLMLYLFVSIILALIIVISIACG